MKRVVGWRQAGWPIPQPIQAFCGLVPFRDPEAFKERKAAEREAREERRAIQEEGRLAKPATMSSRDETVNADASEPERPQLAAAGWYRVGQTFYRIGSGPHPLFWATHERRLAEKSRPTKPADRPPARLQLGLFE